MLKKTLSVFLLITLSACFGVSQEIPVTPTVFLITSTLPVLPVISTQPPTVLAIATDAVSTNLPTPTVISGTTTTQLNVRSEPSTASQNLGMIPAYSPVQIVGQEPSGTWFQILYPQGVDGKGWVTGAYVQVDPGVQIPSISIAPASGYAGSGRVIQQINVRNGPSTEFESLGTLNVNDVVKLVGRNDTGSWLQIEYASSQTGKGWITTTYIEANGFEGLPIVSDDGVLLGTATPTGVLALPTATFAAASDDGDFKTSPGMVVVFSPSGNRSLIYSSSLSSPLGDGEDWVHFTSYTDHVSIAFRCYGSERAAVTVFQENIHSDPIKCGERKIIRVESGTSHVVQIAISTADAGLISLRYSLEINSYSD
jgi:uncharacterized protein YraI